MAGTVIRSSRASEASALVGTSTYCSGVSNAFQHMLLSPQPTRSKVLRAGAVLTRSEESRNLAGTTESCSYAGQISKSYTAGFWTRRQDMPDGAGGMAPRVIRFGS